MMILMIQANLDRKQKIYHSFLKVLLSI